MSIISMIVDRDCHVSMTNREVIYHVVSRLRKGRDTFWSMPKKDRRRLMKECIKVHNANRKLYGMVVSGQFTTRRRKRG